MKRGDLGIENVCLGADAIGREIGNPKHAAIQMGIAVHDVHMEVFRKVGLNAGSLFFDALLLTAAREPMELYS